MEPVQDGRLIVAALVFTFLFAPACIWAGYHFMHTLEHHEDDEKH